MTINAEQQQVASNMHSDPGTDIQRPQLDDEASVKDLDGQTSEMLPNEAQKTMYSVTDENDSVGGMATGGFEKAKLSRSQLEQRSIIQLKDDQVPITSVDDEAAVEEILADQVTESVDVLGSTVRQQTIELEGSMLAKHAQQAMKGSNPQNRPMGLGMLGTRKTSQDNQASVDSGGLSIMATQKEYTERQGPKAVLDYSSPPAMQKKRVQ